MQDIHEARAQEVHRCLLVEAAKNPASQRNAASLHVWNHLSEEYRESNRRAVDHFSLKLAALGYLLSTQPVQLVAPPCLALHELNVLARLEHDSWSAEKRLAGWRFGERRDPVRRLHEWLVPFGRLGEARQRDLSQIGSLSTILTQNLPGHREDHRDAVPLRERRIGLVGHSVLTLKAAARVFRATQILLAGSSCAWEGRAGPPISLNADASSMVYPRLRTRAVDWEVAISNETLDVLVRHIQEIRDFVVRHQLVITDHSSSSKAYVRSAEMRRTRFTISLPPARSASISATALRTTSICSSSRSLHTMNNEHESDSSGAGGNSAPWVSCSS